MNNNIKKLLNTAYNEIGYIEKKSNDRLDEKIGNAGSENYTKYARDCFPELQGMAWCCMFVWWCFEKTFGKITAKNLIGEKTAKCSAMKQRMIDNGCISTSNPKEGDIIFFDRGSGISHIGIIYSIGSKTFSTIEGNTTRSKDLKDYNKVVPNGGGVFIRAYDYKNIQINAFVKPKWKILDTVFEDTTPVINYNAVIDATNVNIRSGAGTNNLKIGQETLGYKLNIIDNVYDSSGRKWYKFIYNGKLAFICADYVKRLGSL